MVMEVGGVSLAVSEGQEMITTDVRDIRGLKHVGELDDSCNARPCLNTILCWTLTGVDDQALDPRLPNS
jgi:hypothetical protein